MQCPLCRGPLTQEDVLSTPVTFEKSVPRNVDVVDKGGKLIDSKTYWGRKRELTACVCTPCRAELNVGRTGRPSYTKADKETWDKWRKVK